VSSGLRSTSSGLRDLGTLGVVSACAVALFLVYGRIVTVSLLAPFARTLSALAVAGLALGGVVALLGRRWFEEPRTAQSDAEIVGLILASLRGPTLTDEQYDVYVPR
jgi:hypothetical protein